MGLHRMDILILLLLALAVGLIIRHLIRQRKSGKTACGSCNGDCAGCHSVCKNCRKKSE